MKHPEKTKFSATWLQVFNTFLDYFFLPKFSLFLRYKHVKIRNIKKIFQRHFK